MELTIRNNQSLLDVAVQVYGDVTGVFHLAVANGLDVTDTLKSGQVLRIPEYSLDDEIVSYYAFRGIAPATATPLFIGDTETDEWMGGLPGMLPLILS